MADTQIAPLGVVTAPADYVIPNAQELTLAAMFAHFDGSAAATAWVPTLQIISDSGHTILEVPQDASVAAAASVEASWAPFLRNATSGTAAATDQPTARFVCSTPFNTAVGTVTVTFDSVITSDATKIYLDATVKSRCRMADAGTYTYVLEIGTNALPQQVTGRTYATVVGFDNFNGLYGDQTQDKTTAGVPPAVASVPIWEINSVGMAGFTSAARKPYYFRVNVTAADVFQVDTVWLHVARSGAAS